MIYIRRQLQDSILQLSQEYPVLMLTGPRQVGKTTLLMELTKESPRGYVSLDDLNARAMARDDPSLFLQIHRPPLLIDEAQYAPELFTYVKLHVDRERSPGAFWLTGSQMFDLMRGVQESLAGRVALLNLFPLSQSEIDGRASAPFRVDLDALLARKTEKRGARPVGALDVFQRLWRGGMPALCSGAVSNRDVFYSSYLGSYLERDIRELSGTIDSLKFTRFLTAAAARAAQLLNYKGLADDAEIDQATAKSWLNILETLGIVFRLPPYFNNVLKRTVKTPKLYFHDTGLVCYLTRWSSPEVALNGAMSGALLENYAVAEVVKSYYHNAKEPWLYYYRDRDGREIDLLMEADGLLHPIEIKRSAHPDRRMTSAFSLLDRPPLRRGTGAVLCLSEDLGALDERTLIVPIEYV